MKVSVVVPTYRTAPEGLQRLMGSLDRQTMRAADFEVIFVDDGSPDDTLERLRGVAETHVNVRVESIENSGWPSRPRNIGIDLAQGEYVAFMDHDDELYPDALRGAYEFAVANRSDVVSGKESRTTEPAWALGTYDEDRANARGRTEVHPLLPMNPHKLYRREFLNEHGIRFPEGRRVLWEDIFFNLQVARHARVVSSLASVPYYHWVTTEGSGSTTFVKSNDDYWEWLRKVCDATADELRGDENVLQRDQLELHQYNTRVVGVFDLKYTQRSERNRRFIFEHSRSLQEDFGYARLDERLASSRRIRAELLRTGRQDLLEQVCAIDAAVPGWGRAETAIWRDGKLHVDVSVDWSDSTGRRPALRRVGTRVRKDLPKDIADAISADAADVTDEIEQIGLTPFVHSRRSRVAWAIPFERQIDVSDREDGTVGIGARARLTIDPVSAAWGGALDGGTHWDLRLHTRFGSGTTDRAISSAVPASFSISGGLLHLVYPNDGGSATVIPEGQREAVRRLTPISAELAHDDLVITLSGQHDGSGTVDTVVGSWTQASTSAKEVPARLEVSDGVARLRLPMTRGTSSELRVGDRVPGGPLSWILRTEGGHVTLERSSRASAAAPSPVPDPAPRPTKTLRRTAGKVLRRLGLR
ncbi:MULTISPECIES: glycosyltransferase family A protein [unclassified Microbacterium]|uniref:glycosyltransferase family 2 protein n=1 Tax=unclassified Microbacterium TaxID=2609290 RepID=UPI0020045E93|nr:MULTISPECIES: glycosyltransferase family A protein [unclassified Microbacterium]